MRPARRPPPSSRRASILAGTFGSAQARACIGGDKLDALPRVREWIGESCERASLVDSVKEGKTTLPLFGLAA